MTELDHVGLKYQGTPGETVTVTVTADALIATFNLRGAGHQPFPPGGSLQFQLVGGSNRLELLLDSENKTGDNFHVVVQSVQNETNNECVHDWPYHGIPKGPDFSFAA
jgi:hypothetical protein